MDAITDPALRQFLDAERASDSARSRAGFGALHRHRAEDATLLGLLTNLAECRAFVTLRTTAGIDRRGTIATAGPGGVVIAQSRSSETILRTSAIASVRSATPLRLDGDGIPAMSTSWPTLLASHIDINDEITLTIGGALVTGQVRNMSRSLLILQTPDSGVFYAVVDAIDEVSISVPGSIRHD
jgi:hypothetical protein